MAGGILVIIVSMDLAHPQKICLSKQEAEEKEFNMGWRCASVLQKASSKLEFKCCLGNVSIQGVGKNEC